jgi:heavy metal translocating P-type ATPase
VTPGQNPPPHACAHCGLPVARSGARNGRGAGDGPLYCCYGCLLVSRIIGPRNQGSPHAWNVLRLGIGAFLAMNVMMISILLYTGAVEQQAAGAFRWVLLGLAAAAAALLDYPFVVGAAGEIARRRLSLDTLIAAGSLGALLVSAANTVRGEGHIYYDTATMLPLLVTFGKIIEAAAKGRASDLTRELETLLPAEAERIGAGGPRAVAVGELRAGDRVLVRPGARFPADGVVIEGASTILEAAFTGEPGPRPCRSGDRVLAGTVNQEGALVVEARRVGADLLLSQIIEMVREARQKAAPYERAAQRAAAVFAPATLALAAAAGAAWLLARGLPEAGLVAMAVIVVACPCALGIATPLAVALAIGRAAREGILIRGGEVLERAAKIDTVFFDKTGTLTAGTPVLTAIESLDPRVGREELLGWLAGVESRSEHVLGRAAVAAAEARGVPVGSAGELQAFPGRGVCGLVTLGGVTRRVRAGSEEFASERSTGIGPVCTTAVQAGTDGVPTSATATNEDEKDMEEEGEEKEPTDKMSVVHTGETPVLREAGTVVHVAWDGRMRGRAVFADEVRPEAVEVVRQLHRMGVQCFLLSGDGAEPAGAVAAQAGLDGAEAPLLPQDKLLRVRAAAEAGAGTAMVGDGINDAPALAEASVGIALGAGTDLARQAGNVVLLGDRLEQAPWVLALGRQTRSVIRQNLAWALGYNAVALAAAAAGVLHPLLAAVAMVVSSLTVLSNSLRLRRFPSPQPVRLPGV